MSNFAAGVLLIIFNPYKVDDYIVPAGGVIENDSDLGTRRLDRIAGVSCGEDLGQVQGILKKILNHEPRILVEPKPTIGLIAMSDRRINSAFRPWSKVADDSDLCFDRQERIKIRFDEEGVTIPLPRREVHISKNL